MKYVILYLIIINVVTCLVFKKDKYNARWNLRRVPEDVLVGLAAIGGSIGALAGIKLFRHKIRKPQFWIRVLLVFAVQVAVVIGFCFGILYLR